MSEPATARPQAAFGVARSFSGRRWRLVETQVPAGETGLPPVLAHLLAARGIAADQMDDYLNPTLRKLLPDPSLLAEMDRAVARVAAALAAGEQIAIFGDYDVDGSVSVALLAGYLAALGVNPHVYIPDRMREGYGPSPAAMRSLREAGAGLVVTVDCGASGGAAFAAARAVAMDVVVLDHHRVEARPGDAQAHVNPNQPGDTSGLGHLCAAGVTFLFLVGLNRYLRDSGFFAGRGLAPPDLMECLDIVGLATVCDVVPLIGVNRAFVRQGLVQMDKGARPGLAALAAVADIAPPFSAYHMGFVFGPRINAGGRVGRCGLGADLLMARADRAADYAAQLDLHNRERQALEKLILQEAMAEAERQANAPYLMLAGTGWHPGVVGIVAGRLKERFARPAFVAGFEGGMGRGSARSVPGLDVGRMVRAARAAGLIESGGGHAMAAGFSLMETQLDAFRGFLHAAFADSAAALDAAGELVLDVVAAPAAATPALVDEIALAGPFGAGNPEPLLGFADLRVAFADIVGGDHVRLRLVGGDGARLDAIAFRAAGAPLGQGLLAGRGRLLHVAGKLKRDDWGGNVRTRLVIEDAAPASL